VAPSARAPSASLRDGASATLALATTTSAAARTRERDRCRVSYGHAAEKILIRARSRGDSREPPAMTGKNLLTVHPNASQLTVCDSPHLCTAVLRASSTRVTIAKRLGGHSWTCTNGGHAASSEFAQMAAVTTYLVTSSTLPHSDTTRRTPHAHVARSRSGACLHLLIAGSPGPHQDQAVFRPSNVESRRDATGHNKTKPAGRAWSAVQPPLAP
jgi:hypothetical protein